MYHTKPLLWQEIANQDSACCPLCGWRITAIHDYLYQCAYCSFGDTGSTTTWVIPRVHPVRRRKDGELYINMDCVSPLQDGETYPLSFVALTSSTETAEPQETLDGVFAVSGRYLSSPPSLRVRSLHDARCADVEAASTSVQAENPLDSWWTGSWRMTRKIGRDGRIHMETQVSQPAAIPLRILLRRAHQLHLPVVHGFRGEKYSTNGCAILRQPADILRNVSQARIRRAAYLGGLTTWERQSMGIAGFDMNNVALGWKEPAFEDVVESTHRVYRGAIHDKADELNADAVRTEWGSKVPAWGLWDPGSIAYRHEQYSYTVGDFTRLGSACSRSNVLKT